MTMMRQYYTVVVLAAVVRTWGENTGRASIKSKGNGGRQMNFVTAGLY